MNGTVAGVGGALFMIGIALGGWLYWHKMAPKFCIFAFLIAGLGLSGVIGALLVRLLTAGVGLMAGLIGRLFGNGAGAVASVVIAAVLVLEVFVKGMGGKKATPRRYHPWLALVLPTLVVVTGLPFVLPILQWIGGQLSDLTSSIL